MMKSFEIIIPCKRFSDGKSRLSTLLDPFRREHLCRTLFSRTVQIALEATDPENVSVVSSDQDVLRLAAQFGVRAIEEDGVGLNEALHTANNALLRLNRGPRTLVTLPIDLPYLRANDLQNVVARTQELGIVPDMSRTGTNILALSPDVRRIFQFMFGQNSCQQHLRFAELRGIPTEIFHHSDLAFDLDLPEDFKALSKKGHETAFNLRRTA